MTDGRYNRCPSKVLYNDLVEFSSMEDEKQNLNQTLDTSLCPFDKAKHNFSTSSEISFVHHDPLADDASVSSPDLHRTVTGDTTQASSDDSSEIFASAHSSFQSSTHDDARQSVRDPFEIRLADSHGQGYIEIGIALALTGKCSEVKHVSFF